MQVKREAASRDIVVVYTAQQPSTRLFRGFDQLMILSQGRQAFLGTAEYALTYFDQIGHPCPIDLDPTEYYVSLVSPVVSDDETVQKILEDWQLNDRGEYLVSSFNEGPMSSLVRYQNSRCHEITLLLRRQSLSVMSHPTLYLGRCMLVLVSNVLLAVLFWRTRDLNQDQALQKFWLVMLFCFLPTGSECKRTNNKFWYTFPSLFRF